MSKKNVFKGAELVALFASLDQTANVSRHRTTEQRPQAVADKEASLREIGQQSACEVQEDGNGGYFPIKGTTRIAAGVNIVNGGGLIRIDEVVDEATKQINKVEVLHEPQPNFGLEVIVFGPEELTPYERELRNTVDNSGEKPSDVDLGLAIINAVDNHKKTLAEAARDILLPYGLTDPNLPGQLKKLVSGPEWLTDAVHDDLLARETALELLKLKGESIYKTVAKAVQEALKAGKKFTTKQLKAAATAAREAEEATGSKKPKADSDDGEEENDESKAKTTPSGGSKLPIAEVLEGFDTLLADLKSHKAGVQSEGAQAKAEVAIKLVGAFQRWMTAQAKFETLKDNVFKHLDLD